MLRYNTIHNDARNTFKTFLFNYLIRVLNDYWLFGKNGIGFNNLSHIPNDVYVADLRLADGK